MTPQFRKLIRLFYPRSWRQRYGQELADLCDEYLEVGQTSRARLVVTLMGAGIAQYLRSLAPPRRFALLFASALLTATVALAVPSDGLGLLSAGGKALPAQVPAATAKAASSAMTCGCQGQAVAPAPPAIECPPGPSCRHVFVVPGTAGTALVQLNWGGAAALEGHHLDFPGSTRCLYLRPGTGTTFFSQVVSG